MKSDRKPPPKITLPPKIGLTKLQPILRLVGISRTTFFNGVEAGVYPPPRVPARKPGASSLWDAAQVWAAVAGEDWREANSATLHDNDAACGKG